MRGQGALYWRQERIRLIAIYRKEKKPGGGKPGRHSVHLNVEHNSLKSDTIKSDDQILTQASQKLTARQSTFKENTLLRETALASFGLRSGEEVLELIKEAQGRGYIVSLENGLLTTPDMAKIELRYYGPG